MTLRARNQAIADREIKSPDEELHLLAEIQQRTPARVFVNRSGLSYRTSTWLGLRQDHAAAADAVHAELDISRDFHTEFVARHKLFTVQSQAASKDEYLLRPELGRQLDDTARQLLAERCPTGCDFQIVIGDGLSAAAVRTQVPRLLPELQNLAANRGWKVGQPFAVRFCRVGIINEIGEVLSPAVVVLLIGERPGLVTAESLSAYMAYRPRVGHTDAQRNLISNIHSRGVPVDTAAQRITELAAQMMTMQISGVSVKESFSQKLKPL